MIYRTDCAVCTGRGGREGVRGAAWLSEPFIDYPRRIARPPLAACETARLTRHPVHPNSAEVLVPVGTLFQRPALSPLSHFSHSVVHPLILFPYSHTLAACVCFLGPRHSLSPGSTPTHNGTLYSIEIATLARHRTHRTISLASHRPLEDGRQRIGEGIEVVLVVALLFVRAGPRRVAAEPLAY